MSETLRYHLLHTVLSFGKLKASDSVQGVWERCLELKTDKGEQ